MKKLFTFITSLALLFGAVSCSDSKNNEPETPAAKKIEGTYTGKMVGTAMGSELSFENVNVTVTAASDSRVNVKIASFGNPPMLLPDIVVPDVKVSEADGVCTLAPTEFSGTSPDGKNYSGTLQGKVDASFDLQMEIHYGAMPFPLMCTYTAPLK